MKQFMDGTKNLSKLQTLECLVGHSQDIYTSSFEHYKYHSVGQEYAELEYVESNRPIIQQLLW